jgi:hypothetical protein
MENDKRKLMDEFLGLVTNGEEMSRLLDQSNKAHVTTCTALFLALIDKGIIKPEEMDRYKMQATHAIDQEWARRRDKEDAKAKEVMKKLDDICPGFMDVFGWMTKQQDDS